MALALGFPIWGFAVWVLHSGCSQSLGNEAQHQKLSPVSACACDSLSLVGFSCVC